MDTKINKKFKNILIKIVAVITSLIVAYNLSYILIKFELLQGANNYRWFQSLLESTNLPHFFPYFLIIWPIITVLLIIPFYKILEKGWKGTILLAIFTFILSVYTSMFFYAVMAIFKPEIVGHKSPIERNEDFTACTKPIYQDFLFTGTGIVRPDHTLANTFWTTNENVLGSWVFPSYDGSMIAYPESHMAKDYTIWIKCTQTSGQWKIVIPVKKEAGNMYPAGHLSWSPDGTELVFVFSGDLVKVNVKTKELSVIYTNIALKTITLPKPYGPSQSTIRTAEGDAVFLGDGSIAYTKFTEKSDVELRRLDKYGNDKLLATNQRPLHFNNPINNSDYLQFSETAWSEMDDGPHFTYVYDLVKNGYGGEFFGFPPSYKFQFSDDKKLLVASQGELGAIENDRVSLPIVIKNLETNNTIDLKEKVKTFLKNNNLLITDAGMSIAYMGMSHDNKLLFAVAFYDQTGLASGIVLISDQNGDNMTVFKNNKSYDETMIRWLKPYNTY